MESAKIFDNLDDLNWQGISHRGYGRILTVCGMFEEAEREFDIARSVYVPKSRFEHGLSVLSLYEGQLRLGQMNLKKPLNAPNKLVRLVLKTIYGKVYLLIG